MLIGGQKKNHDTHHPANSATTSGGVMDSDDEAAGQLRSTDLHCIVAAALEGHEKQPIAYHALRNNYTSLMCASYLGNHPYENIAQSLIFMQQNIISTNNLDENTFSLSKIRSEIHKLKPEDLEESIIEKSITLSRTNGLNENPIGGQRGVSTYVCTNETYKLLLGISQTTFTKKQFEYLIEKNQMCRSTKQWNNLKVILIDHRD
jgi:hypothetical protein